MESYSWSWRSSFARVSCLLANLSIMSSIWFASMKLVVSRSIFRITTASFIFHRDKKHSQELDKGSPSLSFSFSLSKKKTKTAKNGLKNIEMQKKSKNIGWMIKKADNENTNNMKSIAMRREFFTPFNQKWFADF